MKPSKWLMLGLVFALVAVACGDDSVTTTTVG